MSLRWDAQSANSIQATTSSEIDTCEDSCLFQNDIAKLYGGRGGSYPLIHSGSTEHSGMAQIQNDREESRADAHVPMCSKQNMMGGFHGHPCQYQTRAMGQPLDESVSSTVIRWLPCVLNAEFVGVILQGASGNCSGNCSGNVNGIARCCLPQTTNTCPQLLCEVKDTEESFANTSTYNSSEQRLDPLDDTLNPSALSICTGTSIDQLEFKCSYPGCRQSFKRQRTLDRHLKNHSGERLHVCWVSGCQRSFSRRENLRAHYATHGKRGGRNRYVATLDKKSTVHDPHFRGQLTPYWWPLRDGGYE